MPYAEQAELIKALRRVEGQARGIQKMLEADRQCGEVVQQLAAMRGAIDRLGHRFVAANLRACLEGATLARERKDRLEEGLAALADLRR